MARSLSANCKTQRIVHVRLCFNIGYGMSMVGESTLCTDVKVLELKQLSSATLGFACSKPEF